MLMVIHQLQPVITAMCHTVSAVDNQLSDGGLGSNWDDLSGGDDVDLSVPVSCYRCHGYKE